MNSDESKFNPNNPNEWVPPIMALGTWLFAMWQYAHGIRYIPDEWTLGIILSPYGETIYTKVRDKLVLVFKKPAELPKKD